MLVGCILGYVGSKVPAGNLKGDVPNLFQSMGLEVRGKVGVGDRDLVVTGELVVHFGRVCEGRRS